METNQNDNDPENPQNSEEIIEDTLHWRELVDSYWTEASQILLPRSKDWPNIRDQYLKEHTTCAACGTAKNVQAHHIDTDPNKELDPNNLITLCMSDEQCHYRIGHNCNWKTNNPNVVADASTKRGQHAS